MDNKKKKKKSRYWNESPAGMVKHKDGTTTFDTWSDVEYNNRMLNHALGSDVYPNASSGSSEVSGGAEGGGDAGGAVGGESFKKIPKYNKLTEEYISNDHEMYEAIPHISPDATFYEIISDGSDGCCPSCGSRNTERWENYSDNDVIDYECSCNSCDFYWTQSEYFTYPDFIDVYDYDRVELMYNNPDMSSEYLQDTKYFIAHISENDRCPVCGEQIRYEEDAERIAIEDEYGEYKVKASCPACGINFWGYLYEHGNRDYGVACDSEWDELYGDCVYVLCRDTDGDSDYGYCIKKSIYDNFKKDYYEVDLIDDEEDNEIEESFKKIPKYTSLTEDCHYIEDMNDLLELPNLITPEMKIYEVNSSYSNFLCPSCGSSSISEEEFDNYDTNHYLDRWCNRCKFTWQQTKSIEFPDEVSVEDCADGIEVTFDYQDSNSDWKDIEVVVNYGEGFECPECGGLVLFDSDAEYDRLDDWDDDGAYYTFGATCARCNKRFSSGSLFYNDPDIVYYSPCDDEGNYFDDNYLYIDSDYELGDERWIVVEKELFNKYKEDLFSIDLIDDEEDSNPISESFKKIPKYSKLTEDVEHVEEENFQDIIENIIPNARFYSVEQEYLTGGDHCPLCGSQDVLQEDSDIDPDGYHLAECICQSCGFEWNSDYKCEFPETLDVEEYFEDKDLILEYLDSDDDSLEIEVTLNYNEGFECPECGELVKYKHLANLNYTEGDDAFYAVTAECSNCKTEFEDSQVWLTSEDDLESIVAWSDPYDDTGEELYAGEIFLPGRYVTIDDAPEWYIFTEEQYNNYLNSLEVDLISDDDSEITN